MRVWCIEEISLADMKSLASSESMAESIKIDYLCNGEYVAVEIGLGSFSEKVRRGHQHGSEY